MNRNRWFQIVFSLGALACLLGAASLVPYVNEERTVLQLTAGTEIGESMPPHMAVATAALGPFRGLLVDFFWYRADRLKTEGKYYEANTLSRWITTLQPRFPAVWRFQAWNMAYNISVATHTKEERWDWVNKGIRLLRDEGIIYNPRNVYMYLELAWTFWHKIADTADDAHWYYKGQLAHEWQQVMGTPNVGATADEVIEAFKPIAEAPETISQLVQQTPEVGPLLDELAEIGIEPNGELLRYLGGLAMYNYVAQPIFSDWPILVRRSDLHPRLAEILQDKDRVEEIKALLAFLRHRILIKDYNMKPKLMLETMETYGPLDWRHPCAHSIYWALVGVTVSDEVRYRDFREMTQLGNTHRLNVMSVQRLMDAGLMTYDPITGYLGEQPDPRFMPYYDKAMWRAIESLERRGSIMDSVVKSYKDGHENFLLKCVVYLYLWGEEQQAQEMFDRAADLYSQRPHNIRQGTFLEGVEEFVLKWVKQNVDTMENTRQFIDGSVRRGIEQGLAAGNFKRWEYLLTVAQKIHKQYQDEKVITTIDKQNRNALPSFGKMVAEVYANVLQAPAFHPLYKSRIWHNTPLGLRKATYNALRQPLSMQARALGLDFDRLYPRPPGLEMPKPETDEQEKEEPKVGTVERK